jgi:hypothetical protein
MLQLQPFMFTKAFATQIIAPAAQGNPGLVAIPVTWAAALIGHHPVVLNALFAVAQLLLGLGMAWRPTIRAALALSVAWSLAVWWLGEGLGGVLTGRAGPLSGAPGAVVLYALLAVLVWPTDRDGPFQAARAVGVTAARALWLLLWGSLVFLALQPAETASSLVLAVLLAAVAVAVLLPATARRALIALAVVVAAVVWVVGEALGGVLSGQATDPDSGPLLALVALAYWPSTAPDSEGRSTS